MRNRGGSRTDRGGGRGWRGAAAGRPQDARGGYRGGHGQRGGRARLQGGIFAENQLANVDTRLEETELNGLVDSFKSMQLGPLDNPTRPNWGTLGTPVTLRSNQFPVKFPKGPWYLYTMKISPACDESGKELGKKKRKRIFDILGTLNEYQEIKACVAHDSAEKMVAAKTLPQPLHFIVPNSDETGVPEKDGIVFNIDIEFSDEINLSGLAQYLTGAITSRGQDMLPILSALNIVLMSHASRNGIVVDRDRNRVFFPDQSEDMTGGLEAWRGFFTSVRPTYRELMVNVNVATAAFYQPGNLAEKMNRWKSDIRDRLDYFVKGVRVLHEGKARTVQRVVRKNTANYTFFSDVHKREVSIKEYADLEHKNHPLGPDDIFLVDIGSRKKQKVVPAELCEILPNQRFPRLLTREHAEKMVAIASRPPNHNAQTIVNQGMHELGYKRLEDPLPAFEIDIQTDMPVVPGRILNSPAIMYDNKPQKVEKIKASWNLLNVTFSKGATLTNWAVLMIKDGNRKEFLGREDQAFKDALGAFIRMCTKSGIKVPSDMRICIEVQLPPKPGPRDEDKTRKNAGPKILSAIEGISPPPSFLLVILSNSDKHIYAHLKYVCDIKLGIHTVSVQVDKFKDKQNSYLANVALKVNMKLGGTNHKLGQEAIKWLTEESTMLVGMDVTHPGPRNIDAPSIAAIVASVDDVFAQYPASMRIQGSKEEMIDNLQQMMKERLELYKQKNGKLPERILVYRDGVSEGQFAKVLNNEKQQLLDAFNDFKVGKKRRYRPKLTIVICAKRHQTRFYPTDASGADANGNPKPGTVVDKGVTGIYDFDFFLQAHAAIQGTARPTHNYVLHDEMNFNADKMQKLTNDISWTFARATKAVSLVTPAYYADLACERGRCYIQGIFEGDGSDKGSVKVKDKEEVQDTLKQRAETIWGKGIAAQLKDTMFYL